MTLSFYLSEFHSTGLAETEGGAVDLGKPAAGNLGEVFSHIEPLIEAGSAQYRKLNVRNESSATATGVRLWFDAIDHTGRFGLGKEYVLNQDIGASISSPSGVAFTGYDFSGYNSGMRLDNLLPYQTTGFWVKLNYSGLSGYDPYSSARLYVGWQ